MRVTVLGNNGPYPAAGGACSGYLLEHEGKKILLDCGNGVLANLQKVCRWEELDGIFLSHLHSDHMSDMMVLRYAIQIKKMRGMFPGNLPLYCPAVPEKEFESVSSGNLFDVTPVSKELNLRIGSMDIRFEEMKHPVQSWAISASSGGRKFVYSGDTAWCDNIVEFSKGADVLLCDGGLLSKYKTSENSPHLTAVETGIVAREAGVKQLVITHFWPEDSIEDYVGEAKTAGFENVKPAEIMKTYEV